MKDDESHNKTQTELDSSGGDGAPPRKTKLGYGEVPDGPPPRKTKLGYGEVSDGPSHPFFDDDTQLAWLGTPEELHMRQNLRHLLIYAWVSKKNDAWKELVKKYIREKRINQKDFDIFLLETENLNPEEIELMFPTLPMLKWRLSEARKLIASREH